MRLPSLAGSAVTALLLTAACGEDALDGEGGEDASGGAGGAASAGGHDSGGMDGEGGEAGSMPVIPGEHPRIYLNDAERERLGAALAEPTEAATRYRAFVDSALEGGDPYDFQGWHAALLFGITGDEAYADLAIAAVDAMVAEDEALIVSGSAPLVAGDSYLEVGSRVGDMALVFDWCFERVTPEQRARWIAWGNQAVHNVWNPEEASWGGMAMPWSGWSINDPVNNYHFSFLRATMLLGLATYEENDQAPGFVDIFREIKLEQQLVPLYEIELIGGGSREGTGYGVAMMNLFRLYDLWEKSTGERVADLTSHTRASIAYEMHAIVPTLDRLAPIGDHARDSSAALFDYHRDYLLVLGALYPDDELARASRTLLAASSVPEMSQGFMRFSDFLYDPTGAEQAALDTLYPAYHAQGTGHVFVRSAWSNDATWASFIAGSYSQSHAHHDQGSLLVYQEEWLAYDANIHSSSGIRQEEEMHNLVRIESGGAVLRMVEGAPSAELLALRDEPGFAYFAADLTPAYGNQPALEGVLREVVFVKPDLFVIRDRVRTGDPDARRVYQLNTPIQPVLSAGRATMTGASSSLDLFVVQPSATPTSVSWEASDDDMNGGYRIEVSEDGAVEAVFLTVLSIDGEALDVSADGLYGVTIARAGGDTSVTFEPNAFGATLDDQGSVEQLEVGVQQLPLLD